MKLGECFPYIKNGYNVKQDKSRGGIPITRIETLSGNRFNRDRVGYADVYSTDGIEDRILHDGDLLMSHINSIQYLGRTVLYREKQGDCFIHGMNLLRLKADRSKVEPCYAEAFFQSPAFKRQIDKIAKKSVNQASFSTAGLKQLRFPLVALDRQHEIAESFQALASEQSSLETQLQKLDDLVKSGFIEMFSKGEARSASIGELAESKMPSARKQYHGEDVIKYIDISSIDNVSHRVTGYTECLLKEAPSRAQQCIQKNDLLISTVRPNLRNVAINHFDADGLVASSGFCILRCKKCPPEYMKAIVCSDGFTREMCQLTTGANYPAIKNADVLNYRVPKASTVEMEQFAAFSRKADKLRFDVRQQIEKPVLKACEEGRMVRGMEDGSRFDAGGVPPMRKRLHQALVS